MATMAVLINGPGGREAEGDGVVVGVAGEGAGAIVVGVAVGARARRLEDGRVGRRAACRRRAVGAAAAVPVLPERLARAPARDRAAATVHLQLLRARWSINRQFEIIRIRAGRQWRAAQSNTKRALYLQRLRSAMQPVALHATCPRSARGMATTGRLYPSTRLTS